MKKRQTGVLVQCAVQQTTPELRCSEIAPVTTRHSSGAAGSAGQWSGVSLTGLAPMVAGAGVIGRLDWGGHPNGFFTYTFALSTFPPAMCVSLSSAEEPGPPLWCSGFLEAGCGTA